MNVKGLSYAQRVSAGRGYVADPVHYYVGDPLHLVP